MRKSSALYHLGQEMDKTNEEIRHGEASNCKYVICVMYERISGCGQGPVTAGSACFASMYTHASSASMQGLRALRPCGVCMHVQSPYEG